MSAPVKLDIGGYGAPGGQHRVGEDYTTVGTHESCEVQADMGRLPYADNSVDAIWSSHTLEHAPMARVQDILKEWFRVLKPGGRAIIRVPNFDYIARYWLTGPDRAWAEAMVYGLQSNEGEFHRSAFTHDVLRNDCVGAGFEVKRIELRWSHDQETLQAVVVKPA